MLGKYPAEHYSCSNGVTSMLAKAQRTDFSHVEHQQAVERHLAQPRFRLGHPCRNQGAFQPADVTKVQQLQERHAGSGLEHIGDGTLHAQESAVSKPYLLNIATSDLRQDS